MRNIPLHVGAFDTASLHERECGVNQPRFIQPSVPSMYLALGSSTPSLLRRPAQNRGSARLAGAFLALSLVSTLCLSSTSARAADWLQWRGPTRDGISTESGWSHNWGKEGPKILWKTHLGRGCSSFTAAGDRVYTMGNENDTDSVFCLDAASGKVLWKYSYDHPLDANMFEGGPCGSPSIDGNRVYTLARHGRLLCLEAGKVVWSRELTKDFATKHPKWGYAASPFILGDMLLLDVGGKGSSAVAFNKHTGAVIWKAGDEAPSYASPMVVVPGENPSLAFLNAWGLVVRAARDGRELWRFPWKTQYDINAAMPVVVGSDLFLSSGYNHGCALVRPGAGGESPKIVWQNKSMRNHFNSTILWEGHLYGFDEGSFNCLDAATGTVKWKQSGLGKGSFILADGKFIILSEKGKLVIARPSPVKFESLAEAQILSQERCWVTPTLANGRLFVRNNLGGAVAVDLRAR